MGHLVFVALHVVAALFAIPLLLVTIAAHLIYAAVRGNGSRGPERPRRDTHVRCPDCRELIRKEAQVCKHCGCRLIPQR